MSDRSVVLDRGAKPPPVDPRLRARRIEVRRREGRRRLRRLLALLVITLLAAAAWGISRSPLLDVDHIDVSGLRRADLDQVVAASGVTRGDALLDVDLDGAETGISQLGWIESVTASRSWRGTVHLTVVEREPVAVLAVDDGDHWLVDTSGRLIDRALPTDIAAWPLVRGAKLPAEGNTVDPTHRRAVQVAEELTAGLRTWVSAITIDAQGELWIELAAPAGTDFVLDQARARLGDGRDLRTQLMAVETILTRVELDCLAVIDARVGSAPVVTRHEGCEVPA